MHTALHKEFQNARVKSQVQRTTKQTRAWQIGGPCWFQQKKKKSNRQRPRQNRKEEARRVKEGLFQIAGGEHGKTRQRERGGKKIVRIAGVEMYRPPLWQNRKWAVFPVWYEGR